MNEVAKQLQPYNVAIGTIDCTRERKLCDEYNIRGYPTLKFSMDGILHEYIGGRQVSDFVQLGIKLNRPIVHIISSIHDIFQDNYNNNNDNDEKKKKNNNNDYNDDNVVTFVLYDPKLKQYQNYLNQQGDASSSTSTSTLSVLLQATKATQLFGQVARLHRATVEFKILIPWSTNNNDNNDNNDDTTTTNHLSTADQGTIRYLSSMMGAKGQQGMTMMGNKKNVGGNDGNDGTSFLCRLESNVHVCCLDIVMDEHAESETQMNHELTYDYMNTFIIQNKVPTVTTLGPSNFVQLKHSGRLLVIGIVKNATTNHTAIMEMKQILINVATTSTSTSTTTSTTSTEQEEHEHSKNVVSSTTTTTTTTFGDQYYFAWMDGNRYIRFLEQFENMDKNQFPQVFVLDSINNLYWYNTSYDLYDTHEFLVHVFNGMISSQSTKNNNKSGAGIGGLLNKLSWLLINYQPWSILCLVVIVLLFALILTTLISSTSTSSSSRTTTTRTGHVTTTTGMKEQHVTKQGQNFQQEQEEEEEETAEIKKTK